MLTGSNGMCAGNSREEAILQGISEVFERQVHYELVLNNIVPPEIDREVFEGTDREYWFKQYNMGINNGSGYFPLNFVLEEGTPDYEFRGFEHPVSVSNEDDLAYYMDIIRRSHKKLYIADRSSLGFPAYYTFIPSFSETTVKDDGGSFFREKLSCAIKRSGLTQVYSMNKEELLSLAGAVEKWFSVYAGTQSSINLLPPVMFSRLSSLMALPLKLLKFISLFLFFINNGIILPALPAKRDMSQSKKLYKIPLSTFSMM